MTVFLPPSDSNPYLRLLSTALRQCGVTVGIMPVVLSEQWLATVKPSGPSVLHFHWPSYGYSDNNRTQMAGYVHCWAQTLARAKSLGFKIVWTAHNLYPHEQIHADLEQEARQVLLDACDSVIVHCCAGAELLRTHFNLKASQVVIPHGHYCGIYGEAVEMRAARRALGLSEEDGIVYLSFGQIRPYKGLERLLNVFASLPEDVGTLLVAGPVKDAAVARQIIRQGHSYKNVIVHPFFIPDSEVSLYLGAADLLVLPYADVLTSGTAVLAHSMGRPVIAPALGCMSEMIPAGTGWLYDSDSENGLRDALELAAAPLQPATSERCLRFALEKDWRGVAEKTIEVYRSL
jgi:beta-1,4-mannosyltransferase